MRFITVYGDSSKNTLEPSQKGTTKKSVISLSVCYNDHQAVFYNVKMKLLNLSLPSLKPPVLAKTAVAQQRSCWCTAALIG